MPQTRELAEDGTITELASEEANEKPSAPAPKLTQENQAEPALEPHILLELEIETECCYFSGIAKTSCGSFVLLQEVFLYYCPFLRLGSRRSYPLFGSGETNPQVSGVRDQI